MVRRLPRNLRWLARIDGDRISRSRFTHQQAKSKRVEEERETSISRVLRRLIGLLRLAVCRLTQMFHRDHGEACGSHYIHDNLPDSGYRYFHLDGRDDPGRNAGRLILPPVHWEVVISVSEPSQRVIRAACSPEAAPAFEVPSRIVPRQILRRTAFSIGLACNRRASNDGFLRAIKIHHSVHSLPHGPCAFISDESAVIVVVEVNGACDLRKFPEDFCVGVA